MAETEALAARVALVDVAPSRRQGGSTRALLTPASVGATSGFLGHLELAPGEVVTEHYHPFSDKYLYLIEGSAVIRVNGEEVPLHSDEALLITRGQRNRIENRGSGVMRAVFHVAPLAPRPELGHVDTEPVPDPGCVPPRVGG
ncbi:cupin domain-containing protein [Streptomyces sp. WMMC500]|jgi:putative monooxygenase|uniref:cupin domain-containing protein n=1 Tax=Streptomyces sp. WMMC500 TaxID=3015154 RepID=UPI00248C3C4E|nr:cupin domain-containing protein [Streptomyces sp. WMMC500]WBB58143.1 cupin domain-containing protein [Streptomyces sp. WMMC500]